MHVYRVARFDSDESPKYTATLGQAHADLKLHSGMPEARIELFELPTSKSNIVNVLNGASLSEADGPLQTWMLTPRGGIREVVNGS